MDKDNKLSDDYQYAKNYLDIASSNVIAKAIVDDKSVKDSRERKKRRDKRYADKQDVTSDWDKLQGYILLPPLENKE